LKSRMIDPPNIHEKNPTRKNTIEEFPIQKKTKNSTRATATWFQTQLLP